ncbi:IQ calmodulin-binding motif-containing protein 1-like [Antedon mediterranea]|uniref:IQ calmodulin-binding motif-containing protein 1-like n=1 Tax=Antedon mediterranea TaxID=105859 RepID=UPI003AF69BB1
MSNLSKNKEFEIKRVADLAAQVVAEKSDRNVPLLLLGLQDILDTVVPGSANASAIKKTIWGLDLLPSVLIALKQDFSQITGKWDTAASLSKILAQCSVGLDPSESHEFYAIFLPESCERLLILCRNIQHRYTKIPEKTLKLKDDLIKDFQEVMEALRCLYSAHIFLTTHVLRSNYLLQMLITDDKETSIVLLGLIQNCVRVNVLVLQSVSDKVVFSLLDEMIYKLSAFNDAEVGAAATRALVNIADVHPPLIQLLYNRYKGLRPLLSRWTGQGFGRDLKKLLGLLDAGSEHQAQLLRLHRAAVTIQAIWKGYKSRKQLKKADNAFTNFQKTFRAKQEVRDRKMDRDRRQRELHHQLLVSRRQALRDSRQKQLDMIAALHPSDVNQYLQKSQVNAAVKIQAHWKGYQERQRLGLRKATAQQVKAAMVIQSYVRRWLKQREQDRMDITLYTLPPGLSDERRVELQAVIDKYRENHPPKQRSREKMEELHSRSHDLLSKHLMLRGVDRKKEQRRRALLAALETDADLIINAPKLQDANERNIHQFQSQSRPVAAKAKADHDIIIQSLQQPWWRKFHMEEKTDEEIQQEYGEFRIL